MKPYHIYQRNLLETNRIDLFLPNGSQVGFFLIYPKKVIVTYHDIKTTHPSEHDAIEFIEKKIIEQQIQQQLLL